MNDSYAIVIKIKKRIEVMEKEKSMAAGASH